MNNLIHENTVVSIREITPANAVRILDTKNERNRGISKSKVSEYVNAMKRDEWLFNGDSIRISSEGILLDGQHRLTAVAKSGISQHFIVIENMQKNVGLTIDNGKVRNGGDVLAIQAKVAPSMAQAISGAIKIFAKHENGRSLSTSGGGKLTNTQVVNAYQSNKTLIDFCVNWLGSNIKKQGAILSKSEMLGVLLILSSIDKDDCISFCEMVFCGLHIQEVCSQSLLREYLIDCKTGLKKSDQTQRLCSVIKVWNSVRAGRTIKKSVNIAFYKGKDSFKQAK
tara:strand:- start:1087 stop:1932 length:846 start_codon:yes stop_codon:yes gene_type:complete